ncbi:WW domain containing protein [Nitzschia inconspicua]|uniref:Protein phosphatase n=1 Tax=Nitzschia inconspicua TaxID=303405 RepID=A0A9K3LG13_9STRA|nr:WW domain containing protein [Nitzschia inconspicua]
MMRTLITSVASFLSVVSLSSAFLGQTPLLLSGPTVSHKTTTTTCLWDAPEPLAEEGSWQAFLDEETTGLVYYFDTKTGESLWEPPTATFPEVRLPRRKQRIADNLRREYRKSRQQEMMGSEGSIEDVSSASSSSTAVAEAQQAIEEERQQPSSDSSSSSWIEGIFDTGPKDVEAVETQKESSKWFNFLDDGGKKGSTTSTATEEQQQPLDKEEPQTQNWLKDIFGVGKQGTAQGATSSRESTLPQDTKKPGILESFTTFSTTTAPIRADATITDVPKPKPVEKKKPEKVVVEKPKPEPKKQEEKIVDLSPRPIKIEMGSHILPHPAKVRWGGEDAVFMKGRTFGIFDGVSGADKLDGVPLYSRTLANEMKKMVGTDGVTIQDMTTYLTSAAAYADGAATGASTAVIASIGENGFLQALNVGDSYCVVIRDGKITAKTREISHYWECPYQLSEDSPDRPRDGTKLNVELIPGDVIIMGSDGVFDNVDDDLLLDLVRQYPPKPGPLAKKICDVSRKQSLDKNSETPYAKQAQRRGDPDFSSGRGGKVDDVSCVVVVCK